MTKKQVKKLTLEVWRYLRDRPKIEYKKNLPPMLWDKINDLDGWCPLCEVFGVDCTKCPLKIAGFGCDRKKSPYDKWANAWRYKDPETRRRQAASEIVKCIEKWDV